MTRYRLQLEPDERLERYLESCKRIYERMKADGTLEEVLIKVERDRMAAKYAAELKDLLERLLHHPSHPLCVVCGRKSVLPTTRVS